MVLGFLAFITPLTPGSWLFFIGAEILGIGLLTPANLRLLYRKARERIGRWLEAHEEEKEGEREE